MVVEEETVMRQPTKEERVVEDMKEASMVKQMVVAWCLEGAMNNIKYVSDTDELPVCSHPHYKPTCSKSQLGYTLW